jgi:cytochrome c biogenesis protein CcdA
MFSYTVIGILIIVAGLEIPGSSFVSTGFRRTNSGATSDSDRGDNADYKQDSLSLGGGKLSSIGEKVANRGMLGGFLLGALFALAFCPYSALLFFGVLIPLALKSAGGVTLPAIYAIGTGLPVLVFGTLLSVGVARVSSWLNAVTRAEKVIRIVISHSSS